MPTETGVHPDHAKPCTYCLAKPGEPCVAKAHNMKGVRLPDGFVHPQRRAQRRDA